MVAAVGLEPTPPKRLVLVSGFVSEWDWQV